MVSREFCRNLKRGVAAAAALVPLAVVGGNTPAMALCTDAVRNLGFERQSAGFILAPWISEGYPRIVNDQRLAYRGEKSAQLQNRRRRRAWTGVRQPVRLSADSFYRLTVAVRTSAGVDSGYLGFRDSAQRPVAETRFGPLDSYKQVYVGFRPPHSGTYNVFVGFWGGRRGASIWVDSVSAMTSTCQSSAGRPASG